MFKRMITDKSWFISNSNEIIGLLFDLDKLFLFITVEEISEYSSYDEVEQSLGRLKEIKHKPTILKYEKIGDYLARHSDIVQVEHDELPLYTEHGKNAVYAAGYYALKFDGSKFFQVLHGPKLITLEKYKYYGPFITRLEALQEMKIQNKRLEDES